MRSAIHVPAIAASPRVTGSDSSRSGPLLRRCSTDPSVEPLTDAVGLFDRVRRARVSEASGPWVPVREQKSLAEPPLGQTEPLLC